MTIRWAITRSLGLAVMLVCAATFLFIFLFMRARLLEQFDLSLRTTAETIGSLVQMDKGTLELDERDDALSEFRRSDRPGYFEVRDTAGHSLLRSRALSEPFPSASVLPGVVQRIVLPDGHPGRSVVLSVVPRVESDDERLPAKAANVPPVLVLVARDSIDLDLTLWWMGVSLLLSLAVIVAMTAIGIPPLVARALRPLDELSDRAARLDIGNLADRFPTDSAPPELAPIGRHLNNSLDRIAGAFARERRFAADAAHELRTPLAAIRANAEVALKWPEPDQVQASLGDIVSASMRMQALVDRLLELARLGGSQSPLELGQVDLGELLRECIRRAGAGHVHRQFVVHAPTRAMRETQTAFLAPLLENLLGNALTHSPPDSEVRVSLAAGALSSTPVELSITNRAPHLTPADLPHMFEPLWTKSTDRSAAHSGLGLALVAEYARLLGIRLNPHLSEDGEFTMVLIVP